MTSMNLDDRAMLAALHISGWGARKRDPQVAEEVREQHGAADGAGMYTKALVPKGAQAAAAAEAILHKMAGYTGPVHAEDAA